MDTKIYDISDPELGIRAEVEFRKHHLFHVEIVDAKQDTTYGQIQAFISSMPSVELFFIVAYGWMCSKNTKPTELYIEQVARAYLTLNV